MRAELHFLGFDNDQIEKFDLDDLKDIGLLLDLHYKRLRGI
jgi:hypothetical protein